MRYRSYNNGGNFFWLGIMIFFIFGGFKTLFLVLPLLISLIPLLLIGFFALSVFKKILRNSSIHKTVQGSSDQRLHYVELMVHLMVYAMKVDGHIDQRELQAIATFFQQRLGFSTRQLYWVNDLMQHALRRSYSLDQMLAKMNQEFKQSEKKLCVECLMMIIAADDSIAPQEMTLLNSVVASLGIDKQFYDQLKQRYMASTTSDYDVLGVSSSATAVEIKKAYKELCKQYHPDKVQHLGEEFRTFAEGKIKEINKAYDNLTSKASV